MRIILLGPPGVGKGTQAARIVERFNVVHIATGDLLRAEVRAGTPLGKAARSAMDTGQLVGDDIVIGMLRERIAQPDAKHGFLLDGFPRTVIQAEALDVVLAELGMPIDSVVALSAPDEMIIERLAWRAVCPDCGRPGSVVDGDAGVCDGCGSRRVVREDDRPEVVRDRLLVFREQTAPVADYYRGRALLSEVDGSGTPSETEAKIAAAIESTTG